MIQIIVLVAIFAIAWLVVERGNEIFVLSVRERRVLVLRGRIPPGLLADFEEVLVQLRPAKATIRAVREADHARLRVRGLDDGTAQRLRNIFGIHPLRQLSAAPAPMNRNLGQVLGIAWLAWFLTDLGRR